MYLCMQHACVCVLMYIMCVCLCCACAHRVHACVHSKWKRNGAVLRVAGPQRRQLGDVLNPRCQAGAGVSPGFHLRAGGWVAGWRDRAWSWSRKELMIDWPRRPGAASATAEAQGGSGAGSRGRGWRGAVSRAVGGRRPLWLPETVHTASQPGAGSSHLVPAVLQPAGGLPLRSGAQVWGAGMGGVGWPTRVCAHSRVFYCCM